MRTLLSDLSCLFNSLGYLSPVLLKGKIFLQQTWAIKVNCGTPLQEELQKNGVHIILNWNTSRSYQYRVSVHQTKSSV